MAGLLLGTGCHTLGLLLLCLTRANRCRRSLNDCVDAGGEASLDGAEGALGGREELLEVGPMVRSRLLSLIER